MYELTATFVKSIYQEFKPVADADIDLWLNIAQENQKDINPATFKAYYNQAVVNWACHNLAISMQRRAGATESVDKDGNVLVAVSSVQSALTSGSVGSISASFATTNTMSNGTTSDNSYLTTFYGTEFLKLYKKCAPTILVVRNNTYRSFGNFGDFANDC